MKKKEFINSLRFQIRRFEASEKEEILRYYNELIDDRLDAGESEETIISSLGSPKEIVASLIAERQNGSKVDSNGNAVPIKQKKLSGLKIALLVITFPLWFALLSVVFALLIALVSGFFALGAGTLSILVAGLYYTIGSSIQFTLSFSVGLVQLGVSLMMISVGFILTYYLIKAFIFVAKWAVSTFIKLVKHGGILIYA